MAWRSADGSTWAEAGQLPGWFRSAGVVRGRAAVFLSEPSVDMIHVEQTDGSWLPVDVRQALEAPSGFISSVAFGPLGWAAVAHPDVEPSSPPQIVHSVDGTSMSVVPLADLIAPELTGDAQVAVTADAVLVRVTVPSDDDEATPARQQVVVGTPRG